SQFLIHYPTRDDSCEEECTYDIEPIEESSFSAIIDNDDMNEQETSSATICEDICIETYLTGLTLEEEEDEILQIQIDAETNGQVEVLQLVECFLTASIVHFPAMRSTMENLWHPVRGVQISDLGEKSDSFCEIKMAVGVETKEMGWDLSIRAQSRRAQMITSVWLREEGKGTGNWSGNLENSLMEHDLKDEVIVGEEGKRRNRREMKDALAKEETNVLAERSRRAVEVSHQLSAAANSQMEKFRRSCGFLNGIGVSSDSSRGGLCLAWRKGKNVQLQSFAKRHIDVIIDEREEGYKWRFIGFYGSLYSQERA
ncbi:hypothetical protein Golob_002388, partial [Gossypium lobatum]|nr:hypothetical protein [Gossypium lobatum]